MNKLTSKKTLILSAFAVSLFLTGCNNKVIECLSSPSASSTHSKAIVREGSKSSSNIASCFMTAPTVAPTISKKPTTNRYSSPRMSKAIVREG